ncbi:MAG: DNA adenine methylase [Planctomycetes bacterium]|nr:DNA adenine methylase [Planctomycetota bacterium]
MPLANPPTQPIVTQVTFPRTRYQGSKRKLAGAIVEQLRDLQFTTVLDAFGGTGAVAHAFKCAGQTVTYNDVLQFNHQIGVALIENDSVRLSEDEIASVGCRQPGVSYETLIERTFDGIYFTTEENRWLDIAVGNINQMKGRFKRALAWFALCQAAMAKRPYNLFHRKNLYMRTANVKRGFGNKVTWDRSFPEHFAAFARAANEAVVDAGTPCRAICGDALEVEPGFDLVYIDTPYISRAGVGVDYRDFYHFLEGLVQYDRWPEMIDHQSKHRRLIPRKDPWSNPRTCRQMFRQLFERFADSILVVSYRSDGVPSIDDLASMLRHVKPRVQVIDGGLYQYALSTKRSTREVLLIGTSV